MLKIERKGNAKTPLMIYIIFNYPPLEAEIMSLKTVQGKEQSKEICLTDRC